MKNSLPFPIIIFSSIEWNFTWQRHQALALELAQVAPKVIFVESLPKRFPHLQESARIVRRVMGRFSDRQPARKKSIPSEINIISPLALPSTTPFLNWLNSQTFIPLIAAKIKRLIETSPIIVNYLPTQASIDLASKLRPKAFIYDYVDRWSGDPRTPKSILQSHEKILKIADLIITPSDFLANEVRMSTGKDAQVISHGVDFQLFNILDPHETIKEIKAVGYFGGIGPYIDYSFLEPIAERFHLIMVGPVRTSMPKLKNLTLKPQVPHAQVVEEISSCDAFIIPYKTDAYGQGINPIKLLECFATGRPVIGTPIPALDVHRDIMMIAHNGIDAVDLLQNIQEQENETKRLARLAKARESSWRSKGEQFVREIKKLV